VIGLIGAFIGLAIGGIGAWQAGPVAGLVYLLLLILFAFLFWKALFQSIINNSRILKTGEVAEAKILGIQENGSSIRIGGALPKAGVNIFLEVHSPTRAVYQTMIKTYISSFELSEYQVGKALSIKIDPKDQMRVAITQGTSPLGNYQSK
jgi:hypothetical protein